MSARDATDISRPFQLDTKQVAQLKAWLTKHDRTCRLASYAGAIGGRLSVTFAPTSLGTIVEAKCACCETAVVNLTDYDAF